MDTLLDVGRSLNALLAVLAIALACYVIPRRWRAWNTRTRVGVEAIIAFCLTTVVASVEGIAQGNPAGFRVVLNTVACVWAVLALWPTRPR